jgi:N-acyl-D-amino-acid deacylase
LPIIRGEAADRLQPASAIYFMMDEDTHPHPRLWGTFQRVLSLYSRELKLFPLEDAVRRMTSYSAQRFGLAKRGEVKPGFYADICVFDPDAMIDTATFDMPIQPAKGIDTVLCNGGIVWQGGKPGGARLGSMFKRQDMQAEAKT